MTTPTTFQGVFPAITTPFNADGSVDHGFLREHARWMMDSGNAGMIPLGSLGEGNTLDFHEKTAILETLVDALGDAPVIPGIASLSTHGAVQLAQAARDLGCRGLMVLPPYVYTSDWREMKAHVSAVIAATELPVILYNNPVAYRTDFLAPQVAELAAEHANLRGVKESSGDSRRVTALRAALPESVDILVGLDDMALEGVAAGATGWVAGLVNAYPAESVKLFELARAGDWAAARELYTWFLPLLRLDTVNKFVQLIKFVQEEVGHGSARVRAPRLELTAEEQAMVRDLLRAAQA
ncbi:4-hydroxy-tetrahydrodipicolinate synthase [Deinococcus metalli]|uniref:4-hydroxy-tetrahydrodipicolinate synthase n=1 Tax=Deinococcus metalli TaxID=1141878 RepID=A0A7W8KD63_9DEIO|nr:dihydrodipicolinate synthase family protein [Deinococcus metalli]MBB5375553.1 4-hydroxy-tetrahydrodipicolinate synthase [Deinococcus metalli]GHF28416.1 dihydrodipicolinate synthase family protein [Deinococcus metalli]